MAARHADPSSELSVVTVLIVSYNGMRYLKACLDSVLDQDFAGLGYDVMVIDNASRDGSADFVKQNYPAVRVVELDRNFGPSKALMMVGPLLRTAYVAYLNQDVVVHRRWLIELWKVMKAHRQAGVVVSNIILPEWPEFQEMRREGLIGRAFVGDTSIFGTQQFRVIPVTPDTQPIPIMLTCGAGNMSNLAILGLLDHVLDPDIFAHSEDFDLGLRLTTAGYQVLFAPQSVVYHNTEWNFHWNWRNIQKAFWTTEFTVLSFFKACYWTEFLILLPLLLFGKLLRAGEAERTVPRRIAYALMALPLALMAFACAVVQMPRFSSRRQGSLAIRKMPPGWVISYLYHAGWKPHPELWLKLQERHSGPPMHGFRRGSSNVRKLLGLRPGASEELE